VFAGALFFLIIPVNCAPSHLEDQGRLDWGTAMFCEVRQEKFKDHSSEGCARPYLSAQCLLWKGLDRYS
jgi:hypothetical protein